MLQSLPRGEGFILQSFSNGPLKVCKIAVEDFLCESPLGAEMIGKRTVRSTGGCADITYSGPLISSSKHHLEARIQNLFAERWLAHVRIIRSCVLYLQALFRQPINVKHLL